MEPVDHLEPAFATAPDTHHDQTPASCYFPQAHGAPVR
jgi:hypothetical protein